MNAYAASLEQAAEGLADAVRNLIERTPDTVDGDLVLVMTQKLINGTTGLIEIAGNNSKS